MIGSIELIDKVIKQIDVKNQNNTATPLNQNCLLLNLVISRNSKRYHDVNEIEDTKKYVCTS